nr:hypothetical protein [Hassalia byssoidea]
MHKNSSVQKSPLPTPHSPLPTPHSPLPHLQHQTIKIKSINCFTH